MEKIQISSEDEIETTIQKNAEETTRKEDNVMELITATMRKKLLHNGTLQRKRFYAGKPDLDFRPIVKLFRGDGACRWLISELNPIYPDMAWGLCDLGLGSVELGMFRISEIQAHALPPSFPIERDKFFKAEKTIGEYTEEALDEGRIVA